MATVTSIKLDDALKSRVQHLAQARWCTPQWITREAIVRYVEKEEGREAFTRDALRAWEGYHHDGLHLTREEADAWLVRLEAGGDVGPLPCHG